MSKFLANNFRYRRSFTDFPAAMDIDDLIAIQRSSFEQFLQRDVHPDERTNTGLQRVFKDIFPIRDFGGKCELAFCNYELEDPKNEEEECRERGQTYAAQLKVKVEFITLDIDQETGEERPPIKRRSSVYFGEIPLMTKHGTFIINGTERVIVSQLHRSPGVFFHNNDNTLSARIIPNRGSWIDFEFDNRDRLQVRIDRKRKLHATILLRAFGYETEEILNNCYEMENYCLSGDSWTKETSPHLLSFQTAVEPLTYTFQRGKKQREARIEPGDKYKKSDIKRLIESSYYKTVSDVNGIERKVLVIPTNSGDLLGKVAATDIFGIETGERIIECNAVITEELLEQAIQDGVRNFPTLYIDNVFVGDFLHQTLAADVVGGEPPSALDAKRMIYQRLRPSDPGTDDAVEKHFNKIFSSEERYDLSDVGRIKMNLKLYSDDPDMCPSYLRKSKEFSEIIQENISERLKEYPHVDILHDSALVASHRHRGSLSGMLTQLADDIENESEDASKEYIKDIFLMRDIAANIDNPAYFDSSIQIITREDIMRVVKYMCDLKNNNPNTSVDDIDHLGNRRVRAVGELLESVYRIGLVRVQKSTREKMTLTEMKTQDAAEIINQKPVTAAIKEFFGASPLSQFMDQTNPLSEITHKRRLSALGPGGLSRERAGFEVRDVHPTHYGRICPVETPEGPNIGLIASLSTYARVNQYGFIETPYRTVELVDSDDGGEKRARVTNNIQWFSAAEETKIKDGQLKYLIAQASTPTDQDGYIQTDVNGMIVARRKGDVILTPANVDNLLMDVAPNQLVSIAASLVPFLENDDANRALMGANMQRQAVPLIKTQAPLVGTGVERIVARDAGVTKTALRSGVITSVDAMRIVVHADADEDSDELGIGGDVDIYSLTKFTRSNQNTCINQRPLVKVGDRVKKGDVIADGPATDVGELALGQNVVVAFMPWQGYNFEDSILISEKLVQNDIFTSIHIEEFETTARDTKLGKEEITRDIPNAGNENLRNLDDAGIIRIGSYVKSGDILVGKVTPKGESQPTPEEKLLRAIFGEKAEDVKDSSLRAKTGAEGVVINAQVFARQGAEQDTRSVAINEEVEERIQRDRSQNEKVLKESGRRRLIQLLTGNTADSSFNYEDVTIEEGQVYAQEVLESIPFEKLEELTVKDNEDLEDRFWETIDSVNRRIDEAKAKYQEKIDRLGKGDELPPGVIKKVNVYVAIKRKLQVGDKMAGRHGNKGVVSRIMPVENMPYLEDGTPVDVVLNPLGVPSRMNVGQILETHLGWAARGIGYRIQEMIEEGREIEKIRQFLLNTFDPTKDKEVNTFLSNATYDEVLEFAKKYGHGVNIATPVFAGAAESKIKNYLEHAGYERDGQTTLYDGRTGESFQNRVTVGVMYVLKLHHLIDEKIHARSTGPYSLVTQQPLGGKAQNGGQRLGEMEVWALEAYGAAYSLQEFLTVKSDDVLGRTRMYQSIVKGDNSLDAGLPESFNVLVRELKALAIDVELTKNKEVLGQ